jgi:hypothetical protein
LAVGRGVSVDNANFLIAVIGFANTVGQLSRRHDARRNGTQHNDKQHRLHCRSQQNMCIIILIVAMLGVIILGVIMLNILILDECGGIVT